MAEVRTKIITIIIIIGIYGVVIREISAYTKLSRYTSMKASSHE